MRFLVFAQYEITNSRKDYYKLGKGQVIDFFECRPLSGQMLDVFCEWHLQSEVGEYVETEKYVIVRVKDEG